MSAGRASLSEDRLSAQALQFVLDRFGQSVLEFPRHQFRNLFGEMFLPFSAGAVDFLLNRLVQSVLKFPTQPIFNLLLDLLLDLLRRFHFCLHCPRDDHLRPRGLGPLGH